MIWTLVSEVDTFLSTYSTEWFTNVLLGSSSSSSSWSTRIRYNKQLESFVLEAKCTVIVQNQSPTLSSCFAQSSLLLFQSPVFLLKTILPLDAVFTCVMWLELLGLVCVCGENPSWIVPTHTRFDSLFCQCPRLARGLKTLPPFFPPQVGRSLKLRSACARVRGIVWEWKSEKCPLTN